MIRGPTRARRTNPTAPTAMASAVHCRIAFLVAFLTAAWVGSACADGPDANTATSPDASAPVVVAPVIVDGRTLMKLRGLSALPAAQRAANVASRIEAAGSNPALAPDAVRLVDAGDRTHIVSGDSPILSVFNADAALEGTADRKLVAEVYRDSIARAISTYRTERSTPYLTRQALSALGVLAVVAALLALLRWGAVHLVTATRQRFSDRMQAVEAHAFNLLSAQQLDRTIEGLIGGVRWLLSFVVVFAAIDFLLSLFPWTRLAADRAAQLMLDPVLTMWHALVDALPGLMFIIVLVVVTRYVLRLLQLFFGNIARRRIQLDGFAEEWAWPTYRLMRVAVVAFAVVIAYPYIPGSSSDAFKGVSIFFGLLMSLGAASAVANSLAGYILIYRRTFKVGDRIRVGDMVGDVIEMRQQVTHLKTVKNEVVTIPSSTMLTSQVTNYSALAATSGLILHTSVGIGYDTPWRQVEAMLLVAASRTAGIANDPAPFVLQQELGDFAVVHEINVYCNDAQAMQQTYTELRRNILDVFNEFDVAIMTPAYMADPPQAKMVPRGEWYKAPAKPPDDAPASR
jgi:small-conductance mechanosensitive channel